MVRVSDEDRFGGMFRPGTSEGARAFVITPFSRVARTHGISAMADAMVAASLANSLFFAVPDGDAQGPVLRYLVITMLPFAVLAPLIGPLIDRMKGGHRLMVIASAALRAVSCWFMATSINDGGVEFYLYALLLLVFQRAYSVARSALVPTVVRSDDELVQANSKLALISGVAGAIGVVPAGIIMTVFNASWSLRLAMITYVVAAVSATRIKAVRVAEDSIDPTEKIELRGATILMAGSAVGVVRACVGFMLFLVAFNFRTAATWELGLVGGASVLSQQVGNLLAPKLKEQTSEENMITAVLGLVAVAGLLSLFFDRVMGGVLVGAAVGFAAGGGKLAFDSILQRDAPDANRGRAFARFETRFQVMWVIGALIAVATEVSATTGYAMVLVAGAVALFSYSLARMSDAHRTGASQTIASARAAALDARLEGVSTEVKGRLAAMPRAAFRKLRTERGDEYDDEYDEDGYDEFEEYDEYAYDEDEDEDGYAEDEGGYDAAWEPERAPISQVPTGVFDQFAEPNRPDPHLAGDSPVAWVPDDEDEFPWEPPADGLPPSYLDDLDPNVDHPYPWSPDDPTNPGRG